MLECNIKVKHYILKYYGNFTKIDGCMDIMTNVVVSSKGYSTQRLQGVCSIPHDQ